MRWIAFESQTAFNADGKSVNATTSQKWWAGPSS